MNDETPTARRRGIDLRSSALRVHCRVGGASAGTGAWHRRLVRAGSSFGGVPEGAAADFALAATRAETPELQAEWFCSDDFHLVCRADHPLAKRRHPQPSDLAPHPFVHLSRTSSVRQYVDAATHPLALQTLLEVDQLATVAGMVRAGLGISVVPALTLYQFQAPDLVTRALRWPGLERSIYLVRRRDRALSFAASALHEWLAGRKPTGHRPGTRRTRHAPE